MGEDIDFFVGYDTYRIGQSLGLHLTEKTYKGNLAILKGDKNDFNSPLLYDGAMISIRIRERMVSGSCEAYAH